MRLDTYTKAVLTVIAGALLYLCVGGASWLPIAHAQRVNISPFILSGPEIGFRIEQLTEPPYKANGHPIGRLVIWHNGRWVEPKLLADMPRPVPAR